MGAHTALRFALAHPERVAALVLITPAFDPGRAARGAELARWDALARGPARGRSGGIRRVPTTSPRCRSAWRDDGRDGAAPAPRRARAPRAVADALEAVPRSRPFASVAELARDRRRRRVVVASRDEADPGHPLAVGERYAAAIPGAQLVVEDASARRARRSPGRAGSSRACCSSSPSGATADAVAYVITYARMPAVREWDGQQLRPHLRADGGARAGGARPPGARRRRARARRRLRLGPHHRGADRAAAARARDRRRRVALDGRRRRASGSAPDADVRVGWTCSSSSSRSRVDAILSTATFHWIADHERLFARLHAALRPRRSAASRSAGERATSTCLRGAGARGAARASPTRSTSRDWQRAVELRRRRETRERLLAAGFSAPRCWLQPAPHAARAAARVPAHDRARPARAAAAGASCASRSWTRCSRALGEPVVVDYVRLNIDATA